MVVDRQAAPECLAVGIAVDEPHRSPGKPGAASPPFCSVVIPTRDREQQLQRCLGAVAQLDYPNFEIIVVDNSPGDEAVRRAAARWGARLVVEPRRGVSFARNRGARESRGEIIAYLDDDVVAETGWLSAITAEFGDPLVTVVSGPYLPLETPPVWPHFYNPGAVSKVVDRATGGWLEFAAFESPARGGNMAVRASAFESWPGFEPQLGRGTPLRAFPGAEVMACGSDDSYAVLRLIELGHRFVYTPHAVVRHPLPRTADDLRTFHFRMLTGAGFYAGFLFARGYRSAVLRYALSRIGGFRLRDTYSPAVSYPLTTSALRELLAGLKGLVLFARIELARQLAGV